MVTAKPERVPPLVAMSPAAKPTGASLKVKVTVAVSPILTAATPLVMAKVGGTVSTLMLRVAVAVPPPLRLAVAVRVCPPMLRATVAPATFVPVILPPVSVPLMALSVAM